MRGARAALVCVLAAPVAALATPVAAHALKLFVAVDGTTLSGHGFFVGGGRPQGVAVRIRDAAGQTLFEGRTDAAGGFAWTAPNAAPYVVGLDTGDGHFVETTVPADRFLAEPVAATPSVAATAGAPGTASAPAEPSVSAAAIEAIVDRALARRLTPLVEAQERAEARLRFADVMGGVGMIVGLGGLAAWAMARRRERGGREP